MGTAESRLSVISNVDSVYLYLDDGDVSETNKATERSGQYCASGKLRVRSETVLAKQQ